MLQRTSTNQGAYAPRSPLAIAMVWAALVSPAFSAAPQVNYFYPAGGQVGQSTRVAAIGSFSAWPVQVWTDRNDVTVECEKDKGQLRVKIAAEAKPGVAWLRLYDVEGAATARPFVIGTLPEIVEHEPNDEFGKAQPLDGSTLVNGQLGKGGDVDVFSIPLAKSQVLVAAVDANRVLGSPMDAALQVVSPDGFVLAQSDDERGIDPLLAFIAPKAGVYRVRTFAFPATANSSVSFAGGDNFVYRMTVTTGAFVDAALPMALAIGQTTRVAPVGWNLPDPLKSLEVSPAADVSQYSLAPMESSGTIALSVASSKPVVGGDMVTRIELPSILSGQLLSAGQRHEYEFHATKGQRVQFHSESRSLGYAIDPVLIILDATGKQVGQNDDASRDNREAELSFNAPADGVYRLVIRDLHHQGGPRYVYRVTAGEPRVDYNLTLSSDAVSLAAGKSVEVTVGVVRQSGFKEEIEIRAENLPEGVTAETVKSESKGNSAKSVKLKLLAAADTKFSGPIRIVGRTASENRIERTAAAGLAVPGATTEDVWLTVTAGK